MNHDKGQTFKRILHELDSIGYSCHYSIMNTVDFNIPQRRNRVYIVGFLRESFKDVKFEFPSPQELTCTTQDLLDKNVDIKYFLSPKLEKTIMGEGTKGYIVKPTIDLPISKTLTATMHKMHRASQDNYITDIRNRSRFIHDNKTNLRKLTPNECRKLQGFPSDWEQVVSNTQAYKQFGNAITVDVSYNIAKLVSKYIMDNLLK